ncbi:myosin heavy chain kinase a-like protein [Stylonychia lemnae]|uniref:Myosin heavy chain kinase a-like protein n=1 Tax=Stylonychia lemnae TaxID=5949 RepID=A0A078BB31_STYLE|nr:myosin heavy chain kinase a-like protein [Stylonychia lemnae]|eukprot:CDW90773.1 myosin heavy chain kinase a-like protein [Stylonychia lemnae]
MGGSLSLSNKANNETVSVKDQKQLTDELYLKDEEYLQEQEQNEEPLAKNFQIERIFGTDGNIQDIITLTEFCIQEENVNGKGFEGKKFNYKLTGTHKDGQFDIEVICLENDHKSLKIKGSLEYKNLITGDWDYKLSHEFEPLGKFLLKPESEKIRTLATASIQIVSNERDKVIPQIPAKAVNCFCKEQIKKITSPIDISIKDYILYRQCQFLMCQECYYQIEFINKMMLISRIKHAYRENRTEWFKYVEYVMEIFRRIFLEDPMTKLSVQLKRSHDYRWFEIYEMTSDTFEFVLKKELELYIDREMLGEGYFHQVSVALQRRDFEQIKMQNGFIVLKENRIEPNKKWVIKRIKRFEELIQVPIDIAKQYIAVALANAFNIMLKQCFPTQEIFLKYVQPYLAIPLYKEDIKYVYELEEFQETNEKIIFNNFNRPSGAKKDTLLQHPHFGKVRLPHAFTHWTYMVTGGLVIVTDIQGWKINTGQYVMTDPIVFSKVRNFLGLIDLGENGMNNWIKNHECNNICKIINMKKDEGLIQNVLNYLERFKSKSLQDLLFELDIITGKQPQDKVQQQ